MKKTSSKSRPLSLKRETVRVLASSQLGSAQGGAVTRFCQITGDDTVCTIGDDILNPFPPGGTRSMPAPANCPGTIIIGTSPIINPLFP
jgi:hypothetical protein